MRKLECKPLSWFKTRTQLTQIPGLGGFVGVWGLAFAQTSFSGQQFF